MAFREFDITFYETYVMVIVFGMTFIWALSSGTMWIYARCCDPKRG